jgi:hypothetical protein
MYYFIYFITILSPNNVLMILFAEVILGGIIFLKSGYVRQLGYIHWWCWMNWLWMDADRDHPQGVSIDWLIPKAYLSK